MNNPIFVYGEGPTEKVVFSKLHAILNLGGQFDDLNPVGGKNRFHQAIINDIEGELTPGIPGSYVNVLVFRDVDAGETSQSIQQSFARIGSDLLGQALSFSVSNRQSNVYVADIAPTGQQAGLYFVLHLADIPALMPPELPPLSSQTTDAYLLGLALSDPVVSRFAHKAGTTAAVIRQKVTSELPNLMTANGINCDSDKDFLAAYLFATRFWKVGRTEHQERLLRIILDRAEKYDQSTFWHIFASWKTAIEEAQA